MGQMKVLIEVLQLASRLNLKYLRRFIFLLFLPHFSPWDAPGAITLNLVWMKREFDAYKLSRCMYPSIFNSFPVINRKCKKSPFSCTTAHIFVSPGDAPATITQYVARMERQLNVCQTPRSMYLSIFNSFRVIRCLNQCASPKIAIFTTLLFPLQDAPRGNHAKCCIKRIRCLQIVSVHVPI